MSVSDDHVSISEIVSELGVLRQTIVKAMETLEIEPIRVENPMQMGQTISYVSISDQARITQYCEDLSNQVPASVTTLPKALISESIPAVRTDQGGFYLIQLEPKFDPERFISGYAEDIEQKLAALKSVAPFSRLIERWNCKKEWETTIIDCISQDCARLQDDVYRSKSLVATTDRTENLFKLMPKI